MSIEIEQGETVAFIGRNGAGKSTLLKILSRITEPTDGPRRAPRPRRLAARGRHRLPPRADRPGERLPERRDPRHDATRRSTARFDEIVAFSEVEEFLDTPVKRYSSGMTVRLAFSVAAHLEPEILLVDEVLAVGDVAFQRKCLGKMDEVASVGRTVLFVSHNMALIQSLCRRGIYLEHGSVQTDAPAAVAVADYLRALEDKAEALDVSERVDRRGAQDVRVQTIDIRDRSGSQTIASGSAVEITVGLSGTIRRAGCEILIYDQLGHPVTKLSSHRAGPEDVLAHQDEPRFECHIDELLLVPGRYRIDLEVYGRGSLQDLVEGAAYFDVVDGLVRGRPISIADSTGHLIQPVRWTSPDAE